MRRQANSKQQLTANWLLEQQNNRLANFLDAQPKPGSLPLPNINLCNLVV